MDTNPFLAKEPANGLSRSEVNALLRAAWIAVALLWPVALLNYLDRQMMAAMKTSVMSDIESIGNNENWGIMLGQFKWVYAFLSPIGGYFADRVSRRLTICSSLFIWSAITYATGNVTTYNGLLWTRTLMGISEAFYMPAALALIADFHSHGTRSRAIGVHHMAIYFGVILGGFSGHVADNPDLGWRWAFHVTGLIGVIYAIPLLLFLKNPPHLSDRPEKKPTIDFAVANLLTNVSFILLVLYFTLPAIAGWVVKDWMPAILKDRFAIGQGQAGVSATLYVNLAAILGVLIGGWLADRLMRRTLRGRIYVSAAGMLLMVPTIYAVGGASTLTLAVIFLAIFGLGWGFFDCNNMPILSQIVKPELRATGYGIMNFVSISSGGFADWGFGRLRDMQVSDQVIFGYFALFAAFSIVLVLLIRPKAEYESLSTH